MSVDKEKYRGYNEGDTHFDDLHRSQGLMTNREFFSSNAKGGFYEGMEWDEDGREWVPNAEEREREYNRKKANECPDCGDQLPYCKCD